MLFLIACLCLCLFVFVNPIFYCFSLIVFVCISFIYLVLIGCISSLLVIMMLIVYSGAVMILIGYVSAVTPNFISSYDLNNYLLFGFFSCLVFFHVWFFFMFGFFSLDVFVSYVDYFYSPSGVSMLMILLFSLLVTLLIVTSQHVCPNGPFRSSTTLN